MDNYYVYTYAYPDGKVFYVGKGRGNRINQHETEARNGIQSEKCDVIRQIWADGKQVLKKRVYENLTEEDAFSLESLLIGLFERADLANGQSGHSQMLPKMKVLTRRKRVKPQDEIEVLESLDLPDDSTQSYPRPVQDGSFWVVSFTAISADSLIVLRSKGVRCEGTTVHFPERTQITWNKDEECPIWYHRYHLDNVLFICPPLTQDLRIEFQRRKNACIKMR